MAAPTSLRSPIRSGCGRTVPERLLASHDERHATEIEAAFWGAVGASALLIGALLAYAVTPSKKFIAIVMALGAGLLIGSFSFELIDEALKQKEVAAVGVYTLIGAAIFTIGARIIERRGGGD